MIGALLAAFLLAWLPMRVNGYGLIWAAPLSVMTVYASRFHNATALWVCGVVAGVLVVSWVLAAVFYRDEARRGPLLLKTVWIVLGAAVLVLTTLYFWFDVDGKPVPVAWPWYAPIGGLMAFVFGYLLGEPRRATAQAIEPELPKLSAEVAT